MNKLLLPFSIIYRLIVEIRNKCFDLKILKSHSFAIPIINIGNITVGGTGKTPHTEYLIRILEEKYQLAVLSRGYKRKTKDFIEVNILNQAKDVGDEPLQIKQKHPNISVAVDRKRVNGVEQLINKKQKPDIIILDDAFQHRHIKAGLNILLIDYSKPIHKDYMLPAGRLREPAHNKSRANIVIITKCPNNLKAIDFRIMKKELKLFPYQSLFFSHFEYKNLIPLNGNLNEQQEVSRFRNYTAILFTAIANAQPLYKKIEEEGLDIEKISFPDHHHFTENDLKKLKEKFEKINSAKKIIICTEKDAVKLKELSNKSDIISNLPIYSLPIEVVLLNAQEEKFKQLIFNFLNKNKSLV